uniref:C2H2-type domain-containing protein n=1 Tax=Globodera pallida TaxID=36090 RepID=A0A183CNU5_GLOPA
MCQCSRQRPFRLPLIANNVATHRQRPRPTVMPNWHTVTRHRTPTVNAILSSVVLLLIIMPQDALPNESATNLRVFRQQISPDRPEQNMNIGIIQVKLKNWSSTTVLPSFTPLAKQTPPAPPALTTRTRRAWPTTEVSETIVGTEQPHQHRRRWNNNVLDGGRGQQQQQKRTAQLKDAVPTRGSSGSSSGGGGGQNGFAPEPPHPPLPRGRPPPRPRHVEWKDGAGGAEDAALFHDVPFPPPPPPRVPPPPPPLPARYQRRRSRASATSDPSVLLTSSSSHHRAHRSPHRPSRGHPPPPLLPADEFSDVDTESVQSGGRGSAGQRRQRTTTTRRHGPTTASSARRCRCGARTRTRPCPRCKEAGPVPFDQNIGTHSVIGAKAM